MAAGFQAQGLLSEMKDRIQVTHSSHKSSTLLMKLVLKRLFFQMMVTKMPLRIGTFDYLGQIENRFKLALMEWTPEVTKVHGNSSESERKAFMKQRGQSLIT